MRVTVMGGTGTVGSQVVRALVERGGVDITAASRSGEGPVPGVQYVSADLERPETLAAAFDGADRVYLLTPLHPEEARLGVAAVAAAKAEGVGRIVLHSIHRAEEAAHIPHFGSKLAILEAIRSADIPWVVLQPNSYFQNDAWLQEPLTQYGVYPAPIGQIGLSRVDARDIGDAAAHALLDDGHEGNEYPIVGARSYTGPGIAEAWSSALGREVIYTGDDVDGWAQASRAFLPEWMIDDLVVMSRHFLDRGLVASEQDLAMQSHVLGQAPRTFDAYVAEMAAAWGAA